MGITKKIMLDVQCKKKGNIRKRFNTDEAKQIGDALRIYWENFDVDQFMLDSNVKVQQRSKRYGNGCYL